MNHEILKRVIFDQHEIIKSTKIVERNDYVFDEKLNYVLVGLRRSGKSTLLYKKIQDLIKNGVSYNQIIYINFEDERLIGFDVNDFDSIIEVANELSDSKKYYFFDEIQNIDYWEKFARRLADSKEFVYITGSNSKMLSKEIGEQLGGRYIQKYVVPFTFNEYVKANGVEVNDSAKSFGNINKLLDLYLEYGGLPESILLNNKKEYIRSVYQKVLLNDIILHNNIRNEQSIKMLIKKMAETVKDEMSFSKFYNILKSIGFSISKDTVIDYVSYILNSYLVFEIKNYYMSFVDKESTPKYYFTDNGILSLFLNDKKGIQFENLVASFLKYKYGDELYYIKSNKTGIDVDFFVPGKCAIQVTYTLDSDNYDREIDSLVKLNKSLEEKVELIIVSDKDEVIEKGNQTIKVVNIAKYLLQNE